MNAAGRVYVRDPWGTLLCTKKKRIETASFSLPHRFMGVWLHVQNEHKQTIGAVVFDSTTHYHAADAFDRDFWKHKVPPDSRFHFNNRTRTHGWHVADAVLFDTPRAALGMRGAFRLELY